MRSNSCLCNVWDFIISSSVRGALETTLLSSAVLPDPRFLLEALPMAVALPPIAVKASQDNNSIRLPILYCSSAPSLLGELSRVHTGQATGVTTR